MSANPSKSPGLRLDDDAVIGAMRRGDEHVFAEIVGEWSGIMLRMAMAHLGRRAIAEEVVQHAWLTGLRSLDRFERRSSLRTWIVGIVVNLVTDYLEGRLSPADHARFELHLETCEVCRIYLDQFRQTIRVLGRLPEESLSPEARNALLAAFQGFHRK